MRNTWAPVALGLLLGSAEGSDFLARIVRPHTRTLIQSVIEEARAPRMSVHKKTEIAAAQYCQAAESDFTTEGTAHEVYTTQSAAMNDLVKAAGNALLAFEDSARLDDYRRARQMEDSWKVTILAELQAIKGAVDARKVKVDTRLGIAATNKEVSQDDPKKRTHFPTAAVSKEFSLNPSDYNEVGAHSQEDWTKIHKHHEELADLLLKLSEELGKSIDESTKMMTDHVSTVMNGKDYLLSWKPDTVGTVAGNPFAAVTETGTKANDFASPYTPATVAGADGSPLVDSFSGFDDLAKRIMGFTTGMINQGDFEPFLKSSGSQAEQMDKLMSLLSILNIRRLGLSDAKKSLVSLQETVKAKMAALVDEIKGTTKTLTEGLADLLVEQAAPVTAGTESKPVKVNARLVYKDAQAYPGVTINVEPTSTEKDSLDTLLDSIADASTKNAPSEVSPRIDATINILYRLHTSLYALVKSVPEDLPSTIAEDMRTKMEVAADCVLYGRVDGLGLLRPESTKDVCGDSFEIGSKKMIENGIVVPAAPAKK